MSSQGLREEEARFGDPRKMYVSFLIRLISETTDQLYSHSPTIQRHSIRTMRAIISVLDAGSKKKLEALGKKLTDIEKQYGSSYEDLASLESSFSELVNYLHTSYLQEVNYVRALNPHPKPIGEENESSS